MANVLRQEWDLPDGGKIVLDISSVTPFPEQVWREDLADLVKSIDVVRIHLGGDL